MPSTIIIIRHGQTDYNRDRRLQGQLDIPLNDEGHKQAQEAANKLKGKEVHIVYTSDLSRAATTAKYIGEACELAVTLEPALRENDLGIFSGWQWEEERDETKDALWQEYIESRRGGDPHWKKHKGESIYEHTVRVTTFLKTLSDRHPNQAVVLITHGATINRILEYYKLKERKEEYRSHGNGSITILTKQGNEYVILGGSDS